jgi:hypothetical protein
MCTILEDVVSCCGISCSYSGDREDCRLLGCDAVKSGRYVPEFRRNLLPQSSEHSRNTDTYLPDYTVSSQRTVILIWRNYVEAAGSSLRLKTVE